MSIIAQHIRERALTVVSTTGYRLISSLHLAAISVLCIAASAAGVPAHAHDAPKGWRYPYSCCSGYDCREISSKVISERPEGYVIKGTGEILAYSDTRLKNSPDGEYHWCSVAGADDTRTICLFVPPHSY